MSTAPSLLCEQISPFLHLPPRYIFHVQSGTFGYKKQEAALANLSETKLWKVHRLEGKSEETFSRKIKTESALEF